MEPIDMHGDRHDDMADSRPRSGALRSAPEPSWVAQAVARARAHVRSRPPPEHIVVPGPEQESVWEYPRPPRVEPVLQRIQIAYGGETLVSTRQALRVVETSGAPAIYVHGRDIAAELRRTDEWGLCEWKGILYYCDLVIGERVIPRAAWTFPEPFTDLGCGYEALRDRYAFYPSQLTCRIDGERARPQPGGYYGGWITSRVTGPFKGDRGSENW